MGEIMKVEDLIKLIQPYSKSEIQIAGCELMVVTQRKRGHLGQEILLTVDEYGLVPEESDDPF